MFDYLIVGAGFAGAVAAEQMARCHGKKVLVIDRRNHIGGNAYDCFNRDGILIHRYGPHIFHTNSERVFQYLSQFTSWRSYEHRVLASVDGKLVPIPINRNTVNLLYDMKLRSDEDVEAFFASRAEERCSIKTSEDVVVSKVGRDLYEKLFRNYTRKQWGKDPCELDSSVTARIPVRTNEDDRYFTDRFQMMPKHGYTRMFENMLDHSNIRIQLGCDFRDVETSSFREIIYTGPVDEFFGFRYGELPYRSLRFRHKTFDKEYLQPVAVINYPNDHVYTRITEFKHLTGQLHTKTAVVYEYPTSEGDPYYPVPTPENAALYKRYAELAAATEGVHFVGRLATYRYYNMDQVVAQALTLCKQLVAAPDYALDSATSIATVSNALPIRPAVAL
ncbi:MAG: UDP-galactopyranose mutase [Acidobacteriaceae bacterium]|nr:UDP-galactopyranose mutase [Acidobacteriaceae bacterium]